MPTINVNDLFCKDDDNVFQPPKPLGIVNKEINLANGLPKYVELMVAMAFNVITVISMINI